MSYIGRMTNRIQWFEGMLLTPHHFQQADQRIDHLFNIHLSNSVSHYWGVTHHQIDESALLAGRLNFIALEAVMPDGTWFAMNPDERQRFTVDLTKVEISTEDKRITIYLAIPEYIPGRSTVSAESRRYFSQETEGICDENTGEEREHLPVLRPNVMLIVGEHPSKQYISFPILRIRKDNNAFSLDEHFVPPQLKIKLDQPLGQIGMALAKKIREKIAFLVERLQTQSDDLISAEAENAVKGLSASLLPFEAILQSSSAHPFAVYTALCGLAGGASTLQPGRTPPSFAPYNHNDLYQTFSPVIEYISTILAHIQEGYSVLAFLKQDRLFRLPLRQSWKNDQLIVGAKAPKGMSLAALVEWINNAVIATDSYVTSIREKRILGAVRTIINSENEMRLMPAKDAVLFSVNYQPEFINFEETLNIFNVADTPELRPLELALYVPKKIDINNRP